MSEEFTNLVNIYKNTSFGVFLSNTSGKILKYNNHLVNILGYKSTEQFNASDINLFLDVYLTPTEREKILSEVDKKKSISIYEVNLKKKDGSIFNAKLSIKPNSDCNCDEPCYIGLLEDITQQKIKEEEGILNKLKYKDLFENSNDAIFILSGKQVVEFNKKTRELFEIPPALERFDISNICPENQLNGMFSKDFENIINQAIVNGKSQKLEWLFVSYSKKRVFCEISFSKLEISGEFYFHIIAHDVTERIVAEQNLTQSKEWYRLLVETAPVGILRTSITGEILFVNKKLAEIGGFNSQEEFLEYYPSMHEIYKNKKDRDSIINKISKGQTVETILEVYGKDKRTVTVNVIASPIYSNLDTLVNIITIVEDITDKVKLEGQIKERDEMLMSVVNSFPFELYVTDNSNKLIVQNDFSKNLFGDHVGKYFKDLPLANETKSRWAKESNQVKKNKILDYEITVEHKGKPHQLRRIKTPLFGNNEILGIITLSIDITERKHLQRELEQHRDNLEYIVKKRTKEVGRLNEKLKLTNEELSAANQYLTKQKDELEQVINELRQTQQQLIQSEKMASVGVLTAGIAHEINNPINFISSGLTGLEMIIDDVLKVLDEFSEFHCNLQSNCEWKHRFDDIEKKHEISTSKENLQKLIDTMRKGVQRTTEIVKGLRTFSRLDVEKMLPSNIHELLDSSLIILKNKYKGNIEIVKNYEYIEPISCFPGKLSQVFLNILMNAIQSIKDTGKIEISTRKLEDNNYVTISVRDNGQGIPQDVIDKIFDPFFTTKPVGEGTGLGLSIVHSIISEHSGYIEVESEENRGTEFKITLPTGID